MMYNEAIQNLATEIARLCNVPPYYVSADQNTTMTYANVTDERRQFLTLSLQPFISAIEDRLSMDDITARGNIVKFDIDKNYLRTDPLQELAVIRELLDLQLITQEQAMEMTDLTPNVLGKAMASVIMRSSLDGEARGQFDDVLSDPVPRTLRNT